MSHITEAPQSISTHRDVVAAYYVRSANAWVITALSKTGGGAVVVNDNGQIVKTFESKRAALRSISTK